MIRWRVVRGAWGSWIVFRGTDPQSVFLTWRKAYDFARQEAAYDHARPFTKEIADAYYAQIMEAAK